MNLKVTVEDENDIWKEIKLLYPSKTCEMLGVQLAPDGNNSDQIQAIKREDAAPCQKYSGGSC